MASIRCSAPLTVTPEAAWDVLARYARAEMNIFRFCSAVRLEGDCRVATTLDGTDVWERNVTVDPEHRRAVYTVPGLPGVEHHQAEMRVDIAADGTAVLVWVTDVLPDEWAAMASAGYDQLFDDLLAAVEGRRLTQPHPTTKREP